MNTKQRDELAKYCWDVSKITFAVLVVGNIASKEGFRPEGLIAGIAATLGLLFVAMYLRRTRR